MYMDPIDFFKAYQYLLMVRNLLFSCLFLLCFPVFYFSIMLVVIAIPDVLMKP